MLDIVKWINEVIGKPRKKLKGQAICPFVKQYLRQIQVVKTKDYSRSVAQAVQLMRPLGLEAVVLYGKKMSYDRLSKYVTNWQNQFKHYDVEILWMHPDTEDPPLPLEYNYAHSPVIIIQRHSTLQKARIKLKNSTDYYTIYGKHHK